MSVKASLSFRTAMFSLFQWRCSFGKIEIVCSCICRDEENPEIVLYYINLIIYKYFGVKGTVLKVQPSFDLFFFFLSPKESRDEAFKATPE